MTLTRYPYTTIRRINYLYSQPRWEVAAPQDPCSVHHQSVRGEFLRWEDAVQLANEIAVNAGVRIPGKRPRYTIATGAGLAEIERLQAENKTLTQRISDLSWRTNLDRQGGA